eukprot:Nk52_evm6s2622 gene=Nk52_evmTU6s2622
MLPTPDLSHLKAEDYNRVYEPAEDTFLLLDAIEKDLDFIRGVISPSLCVEIGSGSGCVTTFLCQHVPDLYCIASDVNVYANQCTLRTAKQNNVQESVDVVNTDLLNGIKGRLSGKVDVVLFNPPYVVTESEEVWHGKIDMENMDFSDPELTWSWAGGIDGREVIDRAIPAIVDILSRSSGTCYMIMLKQNLPEQMQSLLKEKYGLESDIVIQRKCGIERLCVLKFGYSVS